jgi:PAS domain S-box-containing protein
VWLLFSDQILPALIQDRELLARIKNIEGWFFIAATALVLYLIVNKESGTREKAEKEYRNIFENAPEGFFQSTPQGKFLSVNPAMARIFGYDSTEEMIAKVNDINTKLHLSSESRQKFVDALLLNGSVEKFEARNYRKNGSIIWTSTNARVVRGKNNEILRYEGFITDITQRKNAEQALRESEWSFRGLYENNPLMLFTQDSRGFIQAVNQTACDLLEYSQEELIGQRATTLIYEQDRRGVIRTAMECVKTPNKIIQLEFRCITKRGKTIWVEGSARAFPDKHGQINIFVVCEDIQERKQAELDLTLAEARYRALVEQLPVVVYREEYGKVNSHLYLSPQIERMLGYTIEELNADPEIWRQAIYPEDREAVFAENNRTDQSLGPYQMEYRAIKKDGEIIWLQDQAILICDENGAPLYWQGLLIDVTDQKKAQDSLMKSEISYRGLFNTVADAIYIQNSDGIFLDVNEGAVKMYGYRRDELIGKSPVEVAAPGKNDFEDMENKIKLALQGEAQQFEFWGQRKNGEIFPKHVRVSRGSYFGQDVLIAFAEDITERKKVEDALRAAEARYRSLVEHLPAVVYIESVSNATTLYISQQIESLTGYSPEEWMQDGGLWEKSLHPEDLVMVQNEVAETLRKEGSFHLEYRLIARDGRLVWVYDHAVLVRDEAGDPLYYQGVFIDISKQRQAEETIRQTEERFSKVFEASSIAICITTLANGGFIDANQAYWDLSGLTRKQVLDCGAVQLNIWKDEDEKNRLLAQLKEKKSLRALEGKFTTVSGETRDTLTFYELIQLGGQDCILSMFHDITEQKKAQGALRRKEAILSTIAFAADQFLKSPQWSSVISAILERLGNAAEASRVHIFQKAGNAGPQNLIMQRSEWCRQDIAPFMQGFSMQSFDMAEHGLGRWAELLASGKPIYSTVRDLPPSEQVELDRQGVLSVLCMPIMVGEEWWGFIGLDDCAAERAWSESEIEALHIASNIISAAIQREQSGDAVQKQLKELMMLHAVALASSSTSDIDELIQRITEIIDGTLDPDNCGILLISKDHKLYPHPSYEGNVLPGSSDPLNLDQGVAGKVASTSHSIRLGDVSMAPEFLAISPNIQSELCVPITSSGQVVGVINIESQKSNAFSESDERLINTIAGGLGTAIAKFKLFETERRRAREAENLRDATTALTNSLDLSTLLEVILDLLGNFAEYDSASVIFIKGTMEEIVAGRNLPEELHLIGKTFQHSEKWQSIVSKKRTLVLADAQLDPRFEALEGTQYIRGWMGVPLILKDRMIGLLSLDSRTVNAYSDEQIPLIQTFANQAAIAIENARLFDAEQRRRKEAETLREAASAVASTLDQGQAIRSILEQLAKVLPYHSASVQILGDGYLEIVGGVGWADPSTVVGMRFPVPGDNPNSGVIQERRTYVLGNAPAKYESFRSGPHSHIHSWLGVPLIVRDRVIGMLAIDHITPNFYSSEDVHLAETFANQAAIAIENARLFEGEQHQRLREASMLDLMRLTASTLSLDEVNQTILGHLIKLIPCESGSIQLLVGNRLLISAVLGFEADVIARGNTLLLEDFPLNKQIVSYKRPIRLEDTQTDERYRWLPGVNNIRSFMGVPIIFKDDVIGIATLDGHAPGRFTKEDEDLALAIANNAANAIGNARLFELEQQRRQEAENLRLAASAITSTLDARQVLETILIALQQVLPYHSATIFLLENDMVKVAAEQGLPDHENALSLTFPADNGLFVAIQENNNQPIILYDAQIDPRFEQWAANEVRGWMGVSLVTRGEVVGYITLDSDKVGTFDENSAALAQTFAYQASIAIDNARLYEETRTRLEEMEVISRVSFALRASQDPNRMLPMLMTEILKIMSTDAASIWLYNSVTYELDQVIASGWQGEIGIKHIHPHDSIVGHVYQTGEVHIIDEFQSDPYSSPILANKMGIGWGGVAVPIRTTSQTIGAMIVALPLPRKVEPHQEQVLTTLAEIAGNAIHRAQLYEQSEEQVRRLTALRDVDTAIASSFDLRVTLNILLDHTLSQLNVDAASIISYNPDLRTLNHIASLGFYQASNFQTPIRITNRLLNEALLERRDIFVENIANSINHHRKELVGQENFISYYATPLISKGQVKGILEVYLRRPFMPEANWVDFFHTMAGQAAIAIDNSQLFDNLQRSNQELSLAYDTTLEGWGKALELRDKETQGHTLRVTDLTLRLARRMGIPETDLIHLRRGVLLHDIGKMAVPDHILKKTGPLSKEEWDEMRQHPKYAYDLLYPIAYLRPALDIPYAHHEFWNGKGYPRGLRGDEIPIAARIFAVVDVYDALLFDRPYREAWPVEKVAQYLLSEADTHFDPAIVKEFLQMIKDDDEKMG